MTTTLVFALVNGFLLGSAFLFWRKAQALMFHVSRLHKWTGIRLQTIAEREAEQMLTPHFGRWLPGHPETCCHYHTTGGSRELSCIR